MSKKRESRAHLLWYFLLRWGLSGVIEKSKITKICPCAAGFMGLGGEWWLLYGGGVSVLVGQY